MSRSAAKSFYDIYTSYIESAIEKISSVHIVSIINGSEYMYYNTIDGRTYYGERSIGSELYNIYYDGKLFKYNKFISLEQVDSGNYESVQEKINNNVIQSLNNLYDVKTYQAYSVRWTNGLPYYAKPGDVLLDLYPSDSNNSFYTVLFKDESAISLYNWSFNSEHENNAMFFIYSKDKDIKEITRNTTIWIDIIDDIKY